MDQQQALILPPCTCLQPGSPAPKGSSYIAASYVKWIEVRLGLRLDGCCRSCASLYQLSSTHQHGQSSHMLAMYMQASCSRKALLPPAHCLSRDDRRHAILHWSRVSQLYSWSGMPAGGPCPAPVLMCCMYAWPCLQAAGARVVPIMYDLPKAELRRR